MPAATIVEREQAFERLAEKNSLGLVLKLPIY